MLGGCTGWIATWCQPAEAAHDHPRRILLLFAGHLAGVGRPDVLWRPHQSTPMDYGSVLGALRHGLPGWRAPASGDGGAGNDRDGVAGRLRWRQERKAQRVAR